MRGAWAKFAIFLYFFVLCEKELNSFAALTVIYCGISFLRAKAATAFSVS